MNDRNIAEFERTTSFRQVRDREIEAKNKFCLMHFADLFFSLDLMISPNDSPYTMVIIEKEICHQFRGFIIKY